jgi:hypothetical protein
LFSPSSEYLPKLSVFVHTTGRSTPEGNSGSPASVTSIACLGPNWICDREANTSVTSSISVQRPSLASREIASTPEVDTQATQVPPRLAEVAAAAHSRSAPASPSAPAPCCFRSPWNDAAVTKTRFAATTPPLVDSSALVVGVVFAPVLVASVLVAVVVLVARGRGRGRRAPSPSRRCCPRSPSRRRRRCSPRAAGPPGARPRYVRR